MHPRRHARLAPATAAVLALAVGCAGGTPKIAPVGATQAAEPVAGSSQIILELANHGDADDVLLGADTDAALGVEIHLTTIEDGRASMSELDEVEVPAGGSVRFRPGGLHLMMVLPEETVIVGERFDLSLEFERSEPLTVPIEVVDLLELTESTVEATDRATDGGAS